MTKPIFAVAIVMIAALSSAAQFMPCVYDASPPGELQWVTAPPLYPGAQPMRYLQHVPRWERRDAWVEPAVKINPLDRMAWTFYMPTAGSCAGAFDSYVDTTAINQMARTVFGLYTGLPMDKPTGDIEVWVMTPAEFNSWERGRSTTTRGGSNGKSTGGSFDVNLEMGWYYFVVSNKYSGFTGKIISFQFGGKLPERGQ